MTAFFVFWGLLLLKMYLPEDLMGGAADDDVSPNNHHLDATETSTPTTEHSNDSSSLD